MYFLDIGQFSKLDILRMIRTTRSSINTLGFNWDELFDIPMVRVSYKSPRIPVPGLNTERIADVAEPDDLAGLYLETDPFHGEVLYGLKPKKLHYPTVYGESYWLIYPKNVDDKDKAIKISELLYNMSDRIAALEKSNLSNSNTTKDVINRYINLI